ncbi:oocyte zinc finger protein XlCOF6-like isoform X2 [Esox lucius]|uniref:oocyte zinc finger protein XlCOF6-like isoform X2 n=1 Tax=Esox lucius TaxID=8010 RepID=UPI001476E4AB|nr:oocyte zinc finger protein XlCOF6-like isoform X2 [Esox lucius]
MTSKEMFQAQLSHFMGLLVESAVREMGRLLDESAAVLDGQEDSLLKIEMERVNTINTEKFASFMEVLSKSLMEKISLLVMAVDETEVTSGFKPFADTVISVNPEVKSCVVIIGPQEDIRGAVLTRKGTKTDKSSSSESDNQEENPDPRDEEWLPDDDPSKKTNINLQVPSSTRLKTHRSLSDPLKQHPRRREEDPEVQCGDSADTVHRASLVCSHCGKCFKKKYDLTRHFQTHTKPYNCSQCGKSFYLAKQLEEHSKKHISRDGEEQEVQCGDSADEVDKGPIVCSHCGKKFKKKWYLTRHLQPYSCPQCGKGFNQAEELDEHSKRHLEETFSCTDCDAVFRKKGTLQSHIKRHKTEKTTTCTVCERKFLGERHRCVGRKTFRTFSCPKILQTIEGLANQQKPPSRERKYCCESCGKMFFTTWCLKAHMTTHKPKEHSCTVCGQSFSDRNALRKHRMLTHPREMPCFICDVCGKCFAKRNHLHKHMLRHKEEKPYSCDICGKQFHSSNNCKRHKMIHTGEKLYSCDLCGKSYTQSGTLTKHKLSKHTDDREKPFKCEICSEVCSSHYTLKNHMVTHTGKKPCHCNVCGKGFFNKQALKIHLLVHSGEKPYGCDQCGKRFSQPSHLKYHEHHVHTGVEACVCDICGKAYANKRNLKLHKCTAKPEVL